jgi:hypothetical protein
MNSPNVARVIHKNDLGSYLSSWKYIMNMMSNSITNRISKEEGERYRIAKYPKPFESFFFNSSDFPIMLSYLDNRLRVLEDTQITPNQFPYQAYDEAKVFLKICYVFFLVLLDAVSGIIEYFYKKNEPTVGVTSE